MRTWYGWRRIIIREAYTETLIRKGEFDKLVKYKEKVRQYYLANKHKWKTSKQLKEEGGEEYKDKARKWGRDSYHRRKQDPINIKYYLLRHAKARAAKKQIPFNITIEDIVLPDVCPYLKVPFDRNTRKYGYSLDRIIPEKGYIKGNIQVITQLANAMKWESTPAELVQFAKSVLEKEDTSVLINADI